MKLLQFLLSTIKPDYKHYMNREPVRCWRKTKKLTILSQGHESGNVNHIKARYTSLSSFCSDLQDHMVAGDTLEYEKFCNKDLKPSLRDICWSSQRKNSLHWLSCHIKAILLVGRKIFP
ncbi:hypothetical protein PVAP13_8NG326400 [Panicum virgatum]|uniref:Uncharacterized protein n=1 Tax=Panicum virgatum TaxID=38727 RepID=A0A8T0PIL3_PANVG|nr:hypothetical protein PVAP13_8NG326400 [Panicum virgatum]